MIKVAGEQKLLKHQELAKAYNNKRALTIEALDLQLAADRAAAQTNSDPVIRDQRLADAQKRYADAYPAPDEYPTLSLEELKELEETGENGGSSEMPVAAKDAFSQEKFSEFLSLVNQQDVKPAIANRPAIINAAGDQWTADIFRALGDPGREGHFSDNRTFFGFTTVSVEPGLKTKKGVSARVSANAGIEYVDAREEVVLRLMASNAETWFKPHDLMLIARDYGYNLDSLETAFGAPGPGDTSYTQESLEGDPERPIHWSVFSRMEHLCLAPCLALRLNLSMRLRQLPSGRS